MTLLIRLTCTSPLGRRIAGPGGRQASGCEGQDPADAMPCWSNGVYLWPVPASGRGVRSTAGPLAIHATVGLAALWVAVLYDTEKPTRALAKHPQVGMAAMHCEWELSVMLPWLRHASILAGPVTTDISAGHGILYGKHPLQLLGSGAVTRKRTEPQEDKPARAHQPSLWR